MEGEGRSSLRGLAGIRARAVERRRPQTATEEPRRNKAQLRETESELNAWVGTPPRARSGGRSPAHASRFSELTALTHTEMTPESADPLGHPGLRSVMSQWVDLAQDEGGRGIDGGESNIHSICETLRSCVKAGELIETTPLRVEIEACAADRPNLALQGRVDKYHWHFMQFKKAMTNMQRGAGRALRRRSSSALQHCVIVPVPNPRLYAFEVCVAWQHLGNEYRAHLYSKLKTKEFPNAATLLGTLAEILTFLHELHAAQGWTHELNEDNRRLRSENVSFADDLQLAQDLAQSAQTQAQTAENEVVRLREEGQKKDREIQDLLSDEARYAMETEIEELKHAKAQLDEDLKHAANTISALQEQVAEQSQSFAIFQAESLEREAKARKAYHESLEFLQQDCRVKVSELTASFQELEEDVRLERLESAQLRAQLDRAQAHVNSEVEMLDGMIERCENVLLVVGGMLAESTPSRLDQEQKHQAEASGGEAKQDSDSTDKTELAQLRAQLDRAKEQSTGLFDLHNLFACIADSEQEAESLIASLLPVLGVIESHMAKLHLQFQTEQAKRRQLTAEIRQLRTQNATLTMNCSRVLDSTSQKELEQHIDGCKSQRTEISNAAEMIENSALQISHGPNTVAQLEQMHQTQTGVTDLNSDNTLWRQHLCKEEQIAQLARACDDYYHCLQKILGQFESVLAASGVTHEQREIFGTTQQNGRQERIHILADEIRSELSEVLSLVKDSNFEIRDIGRESVQKIMHRNYTRRDARAIINIMLAKPACLNTQELGCATMWSLCQGDDHSNIMVEVTQHLGIHAVISALRIFPDAVSLQEPGCALLCSLATYNNDALSTIVDQGGLVAMASSLEIHWSSVFIVQHILGFLRQVSKNSECNLALAGCLDLRCIVILMREFRGHAILIEDVLHILAFLLALKRGEMTETIGQEPVAGAVLKAMENHLHRSSVQMQACKVLQQLCCHSTDIFPPELQVEAVRLLLSLMDANPSNNELLLPALIILTHMMQTDTTLTPMTTDGGIKRIAAVVRSQHIRSERNMSQHNLNIIAQCLSLLTQITGHSTHLLIAREDAIGCVVDTMSVFMDCNEVVIGCCKALTVFAGFAANGVRIGESGAIDVIRQVLTSASSTRDTLHAVLALYTQLSEQLANIEVMLRDDNLQVLLECLHAEMRDGDQTRLQTQSDADLLSSLCTLLSNLAVHEGARTTLGSQRITSLIMKGIRRHFAAAYAVECVKRGFVALMMMAANSLCQREIGLEGVELTFEVLRSTPYRYDHTTLEAGIGLLWNLSYDQKNLAHICDQGGLQWILDIIRGNMNHPKVLERACGALWNFATTSDNQAKLANFGGISVIVKSMRRWRNHEGLQCNGRGALQRFPRSVLTRVLEFESDPTSHATSSPGLSQNGRSKESCTEHMSTMPIKLQSESPIKTRPSPCLEQFDGPLGMDGKSSVSFCAPGVSRNGGHDRSGVICFYSVHPKSQRVEVLFQDFRVSFHDFRTQLEAIFGCDTAAFVYSWMGAPTPVSDSESFDVCRTRVQDLYCGSGDQTICISVHELNDLSATTTDAVATATATARAGRNLSRSQSVPTNSFFNELPAVASGNTVQDHSTVSHLTDAGTSRIAQTSLDQSTMPVLHLAGSSVIQGEGKSEDQTTRVAQQPASGEEIMAMPSLGHPAPSVPEPNRTKLGSLKLHHTVLNQEELGELGESNFPYYADSTVQTLEEEARKFVAEKKIPTSHISAIVQAAMRKKEKALAARGVPKAHRNDPPK